MTTAALESVLSAMHIIALATSDDLTRVFLLTAIGEDEDNAAVELSETNWGEYFDPFDQDNRRQQIREILLQQAYSQPLSYKNIESGCGHK